MAQLIVRRIDDDIKLKLKERARRKGRSTEEEVREILRDAVKHDGKAAKPLGKRLRERFLGIGLKQDIPELRGRKARPADFSR